MTLRSDPNIIRVYRPTADGRRVMFVFLHSPRLKVEPLSLVAFCVFHPGTREYHSYLFTESYKYDITRELSRFVNQVCSYEEFSRIAKMTRESFYKLCCDLHLDGPWAMSDFPTLF